MSTEVVERTFIDPEEITVLGDCCNGYTPLLEVNQALIAWSYRNLIDTSKYVLNFECMYYYQIMAISPKSATKCCTSPNRT